MEEFDYDTLTNEFAKAIAQITDMFAPIEEAARGYRAKLEANGWSPTVAESMAAQYFTVLMSSQMTGK